MMQDTIDAADPTAVIPVAATSTGTSSSSMLTFSVVSFFIGVGVSFAVILLLGGLYWFLYRKNASKEGSAFTGRVSSSKV